MSSNQDAGRSEGDAQLEREIRNERKFSLEEAVGRMAGAGAMKGESPVARKTQAILEIETLLESNLRDATGALHVVLLRRIKESEHLLKDFENPLATLAAYCREVVDSEYGLKSLVRETDVECGRILHERPHFDFEGSPSHPDDCYTVKSVRCALLQLMQQLDRR
ncbi:MAG: hypothetical protein C0485_17510 [Pirellula sp.]|nr:hypothetical protein [Pirellula sp.]